MQSTIAPLQHVLAEQAKEWSKNRRRGGIEPLHVSMPRELKYRPGTSPTHPGMGNVLYERSGHNRQAFHQRVVGIDPSLLHARSFGLKYK